MSRRMLLICVAALAAAQTEPIYRSGAQLVQVDVVVRTDKGAVQGLTKDDFTLQDKGKTQNIAVFAAYEKGPGTGTAKPLPAGVVSNRINSTGENPKSATIILFDRSNMIKGSNNGNSSKNGNSSNPANTAIASGAEANARKQLLELLTTLKGTDKVGLYSLYQDLNMVRDFTDDAAPLIDAAKRVAAGPEQSGDKSSLDAKLRDALTPGQDLENVARADITANAFRSIARRMSGVQGRKSLIWIASSFPLTYGDSVDRRSNDEAEVANIANILSEANIALYSIDPRGAGTSFSEPASANSNNSAQENRVAPTKGRGGVTQLDGLQQSASSLSGTQAMEIIANQTGGKAFINVNDISGPIREAMGYADLAYTLGFYVEDKSLDGKKHDLNVKLNKKEEGAKVYFRRSYLAIAHPAHPPMNELVADRLDANKIGLMAVAFPDSKRPGVDAVQVQVDLKDLQFEHVADKWAASFDLALAIENGAGEPQVAVSPTNLSLTDQQLQKGLNAASGGLIVDNTVPAPAKATTLRVVVQDKGTGAAGSVRIPLPAK